MHAVQPALIVNITDLSAFFPWPGYIQHAVSKAGLLHLTRTSALALGPGVRVNAIAPGAVLPPPSINPEGEYWQRVGQKVPLKRVGNPEYVAQTVVFLAYNDYITGTAIPVDGGEHLVGLLE